MSLCLKPWEPGQWSRYSDYATGWAIQRSNPSRGKTFFSPPKRPDRLWGSLCFLFSWYWSSFPGINHPGLQVDCLPPSAEVNSECSFTFSPPTCPHVVDRDELYLWLSYACTMALASTQLVTKMSARDISGVKAAGA